MPVVIPARRVPAQAGPGILPATPYLYQAAIIPGAGSGGVADDRVIPPRDGEVLHGTIILPLDGPLRSEAANHALALPDRFFRSLWCW